MFTCHCRFFFSLSFSLLFNTRYTLHGIWYPGEWHRLSFCYTQYLYVGYVFLISFRRFMAFLFLCHFHNEIFFWYQTVLFLFARSLRIFSLPLPFPPLILILSNRYFCANLCVETTILRIGHVRPGSILLASGRIGSNENGIRANRQRVCLYVFFFFHLLAVRREAIYDWNPLKKRVFSENDVCEKCWVQSILFFFFFEFEKLARQMAWKLVTNQTKPNQTDNCLMLFSSMAVYSVFNVRCVCVRARSQIWNVDTCDRREN